MSAKCLNGEENLFDQNQNCIDVKNEPSLTSAHHSQTRESKSDNFKNIHSLKYSDSSLTEPTCFLTHTGLTTKSLILNENLVNTKEENYKHPDDALHVSGNVDQSKKRMSTGSNHGQDTGRMTGSSLGGNSTENLSWLANVATSQNQINQQPSEGMLSGRSTGQSESASLSSTMLASAASPGVFRPPQSVADPTSRLLSSSGQYASLYSGGNSPYSSLHSGQVAVAAAAAAQGASMSSVSPYNFYPQFAASHGYPHRSVMSGHYPHIESYSAVLQSMGSQVQHAVQSQLPPNTYIAGHVPQYSLIGASHQRSMSTSASPSPSSGIRQSPSSGGFSPGEASHTDLKSSTRNEDVRERDIETTGVNFMSHHIKEERAHSLSALELSGGKSVSFKDPPRRDLVSKDLNNKVPTGKEGSLKHRILTRPSDSAIESLSVDARYSAFSNRAFTEPVSKRPRNIYEQPSAFDKSGNSGDDPSERGGGNLSNLHYPPHFMKGSIIQLTNGEIKRVEDLQTDDFVHSAEISNDLKIDSSTVVRIDENLERGTATLGFVVGEHKVQVTVEASLEHPFFVFGQGWSACEPERTRHRYSLECHKLTVGDVCVSLTHKEAAAKAAELSKLQQQQHTLSSSSLSYSMSPAVSMATSNVKSTVSFANQHFEMPSISESKGKHSGIYTLAAAHETSDQQTMDSSRPPRKRNWSSPQESYNHKDS